MTQTPRQSTLFQSTKVLILGLFLTAPLYAAALPAGITAGPSYGGMSEYRLANGLTILLYPDESKAKVSGVSQAQSAEDLLRKQIERKSRYAS